MSLHPRIEARVSAQERRQINLDARIEEVSEDMTVSFKQLSEDVKQLSEDMTVSFKGLDAYLAKTEERFDKIEAMLILILARLPQN